MELTQVPEDSVQDFELDMTQDSHDGIDPQEVLKLDYMEDPESVCQTGILVSVDDDASKPAFFFIKDSQSSVTIGSAFRSSCDIKLEGKQAVGISNEAMTVSYYGNTPRLTIRSSNRMTFLLRRGDKGGTEFMKKGDSADIFDGDWIEFKGAAATVSFHRAPPRIRQPTPDPEIKYNQKTSYQKKDWSYLKMASKEKRKVTKAQHLITKRKNLTSKQKQAAATKISAAAQTDCPFQKQYGNCRDRYCVFKHGCPSDKNKEHSGVVGIVDMWNDRRGFGFVRTEDGRRYYLHVTALAQSDIQPYEGSHLVFDTRPAPEAGKTDEAINARYCAP